MPNSARKHEGAKARKHEGTKVRSSFSVLNFHFAPSRLCAFAPLTVGLALGATATAAQSKAPAKAPDKSNILFLIVDDLRPELGCYGEKHMITPHIDALAGDGTLFTRAYVQYAVSAASRASFLTGCYPQTTGVGYPYSEYFVNTFLPSHPSIQKYMHEQGFYSRTLGKVHHGLGEELSEKHYSPKKSSAYLDPAHIAVENNKQERPLYEFLPLEDNKYADGQTAIETVQTIRRAVKSGKPFFIAAGFLKPHLPFVAPKRYYDMYEGREIPPCPFPTPTEGETEWSRSFVNVNNFKGGFNDATHPVNFERAQELRRAYFACATFTDAQIGLVINELKKQGVYDNTAIILIGDHGWHLGDNAMWGKQANFERTTRTPLIIKSTGAKFLTSTDALTEFVDIYPTICDFGNVSTPQFVEGSSLAALLRGERKEWKTAAFSEHPRGKVLGKAIRTDRYRYVEWRENGNMLGHELYDHSIDPLESKNIAGANKKLCDQLSAQLKAGWRAALPAGVTNLSNNPVAPKSPGWGPEAKKEAAQKAVPKSEIGQLLDESKIKTVKSK